MDNLKEIFMDKQTVNFNDDDFYKNEEEYDFNAEEEFQNVNSKKNHTFKDTVTVQCIICILIMIAVVVSNITINSTLFPYLNKYKAEVKQDTEIDEYLIKIYKILQRW